MNTEILFELTSRALWLSVMYALPAVVVASVVGLVIALLQAVTSLQDSTISQGLKLVATALTLLALGRWMGAGILAFAEVVLQEVLPSVPR